jgi:hypothetical protein
VKADLSVPVCAAILAAVRIVTGPSAIGERQVSIDAETQLEVRHAVFPRPTDAVGFDWPKFEPAIETVDPPDIGPFGTETYETIGASNVIDSSIVPPVVCMSTDDANPAPTPAGVAQRTEETDAHEDVLQFVSPSLTVGDAVSEYSPKLMP